MPFFKLISNSAFVSGIASNLFLQRVFSCFAWIGLITVFGTLGFVWVENWNLADSFYMTVITMSTVGFSETRELSAVGRAFTSLLIFLSIIGMSCWTASITSAFVSGDLSGTFTAKRTRNMIQSFYDHTIVFGSCTMAATVIDRLSRAGQKIVLIDNDVDQVKTIQSKYPEVMVIHCSPKSEMALADANVFQAKNVVSVLESEFDNLLIAMSVKELDPDIFVITRANDPKVASRMLKTGVDEVICPSQLSGDRVADLIASNVELTSA